LDLRPRFFAQVVRQGILQNSRFRQAGFFMPAPKRGVNVSV
jgi:hypothetical protein